MQRRIAHLDMDAFYANVELLRYPHLRGQALVIGGRRVQGAGAGSAAENAAQPRQARRLHEYAGRSVATTATYEARALGVHSGMGLMKAAKLAPQAWLLPADFEQYTRYSRLFKAAVAQIAPQIEDRGIDEIYVDLSALEGHSRGLGLAIKASVRAATGLSCSIGIAANKLLAKIASDLDKPDALTILEDADLTRRIWPLPVRKINGVGPRANEKLAALGLETIGAVARADALLLRQHFGAHYANWLLRAARGEDERPVVTHSEPKSISRETTFERDLDAVRDRAVLAAILLELCERLSADLKRKGYRARAIGVRVRYADFCVVTRVITLGVAVDDAGAIRAAVRSCLKRVRFERKLRLLGVRVGGLVPAAREVEGPEPIAAAQASLFAG